MSRVILVFLKKLHAIALVCSKVCDFLDKKELPIYTPA